MKKNLITVAAAFAIFIAFLSITGAVYEKNWQKAVIVGFPTVKQMTAEERDAQFGLFGQDFLVHVRILGTNKITYAVCTFSNQKIQHNRKSVGDTIDVNDCFNNGQYLVKTED